MAFNITKKSLNTNYNLESVNKLIQESEKLNEELKLKLDKLRDVNQGSQKILEAQWEKEWEKQYESWKIYAEEYHQNITITEKEVELYKIKKEIRSKEMDILKLSEEMKFNKDYPDKAMAAYYAKNATKTLLWKEMQNTLQNLDERAAKIENEFGVNLTPEDMELEESKENIVERHSDFDL